MLRHGFAQGLGGTPLQGADDCFVLLHSLQEALWSSLVVERDRARDTEHRFEKLEETDDESISPETDQVSVELQVVLDELVTVVDRFLHRLEIKPEPFNILRRRTLGRLS